ncbi:MAG: hypothetical protein ABEJ95_05690 [Candidatus Nanohalobium sp.]
MSKTDQLFRQETFEYDEQLFFQALNEALEEWRKNDLYSKRLENKDIPEKIDSWEDVYKLPAVDMREFKDHSEDLVIGSPDEEKALYSSGTTSDTKSFAARSEEGLEIHQDNLQRFAKSCIGEVDYSAGLGPQDSMLDKLPTKLSRRALFNYIRWLMDQYNSSHHLYLNEDGDVDMELEKLTKNLKNGEGRGIFFGAATQVEKYAQYLEKTGQQIDLGEEGLVATGGGWKGTEAKSKEEYRNMLVDKFNIKPENHLDFYSASEFMFFMGNKAGDENPDLKRIPGHGFAYLADEEKFKEKGKIEPVEVGEVGLLVVVDPLNRDYPGVILTDDRMRKTGGKYGEDVRLEYIGRSTL